MELPKYVKIDRTALRLKGDKYYRDAGQWSVGYKIIDGKLLSWHWRHGHPWLHRVELVECTEQEWRENNGGYGK